MPRGGARVGAGRLKGGKNRKGAALPTAKPKSQPTASAPGKEPGKNLPLAYMLDVMNDPEADELRRDRMAIAAAPFLHAKAGETGKKGERQQAADRAGMGKFAPAAAPRLVVDNAK